MAQKRLIVIVIKQFFLTSKKVVTGYRLLMAYALMCLNSQSTGNYNIDQSLSINIFRMKKVLIALDYEPPAQKIAETGYALAKGMNAEIVLLHVLSDANYYASLNYFPVMGYEGFNNLKYASGGKH